MKRKISRRQKKHQKDCLPRIILAAFVVLSTSHFFCRFDVATHMEAMFTRAWAESTQASAEVGQPAAGTVLPQAVRTITYATIERNPFMAPEDLVEKKDLPKPTPTSGHSQAGNMPANLPNNRGNGGGAVPGTPAVPTATLKPSLAGIVNKGGESIALISFMGNSGAYRVGQDVGGGYSVSNIGSNYVDLTQGGQNTHLVLGR